MGESAYIDYCRNINLDMLELMGSEYVIDHVVAEHNIRMKEEMFRVYVSDIAKAIAEKSAFDSMHVHKRYYDLINAEEEQDGKTGDEIALEVIERAGLKVRDDESI